MNAAMTDAKNTAELLVEILSRLDGIESRLDGIDRKTDRLISGVASLAVNVGRVEQSLSEIH